MKVGILTFHRAENFGAALQVYAMQQYLKKIGIDSEVIDYRCMSIEHHYDIFNPYVLISRKNIFKTLILYFKRLINSRSLLQKKRMFENFRETMLKQSRPIGHINDDLGYDAYIVGSDQVWRLDLTGGFDGVYFLDFPVNPNSKRISYAASSENTTFNYMRKFKTLISQKLNNFNAISVREDDFAEELRSYTNKKIQVCLDPTFLLPKEQYENIAAIPNISNYVLVYHLFETEMGRLLADNISVKEGKNVVEIHAGSYSPKDDEHIHLSTFGPLEMLGYIKNADVVITTSFHGVALSLILNKDFWVIDKGQNARIKNLLGKLNLESRIVASITSIKDYAPIDYVKVNSLLTPKILDSKNFLKVSLGGLN